MTGLNEGSLRPQKNNTLALTFEKKLKSSWLVEVRSQGVSTLIQNVALFMIFRSEVERLENKAWAQIEHWKTGI